MSPSRREFLTRTAAGIAGVAVSGSAAVEAEEVAGQPPPTPVAGTPPAFGTAPAAGPEVTAATVAEAGKLVRVDLTPAERNQVALNWRQAMAPLMERRCGPRKVVLEGTLAPASRWDPVLPGTPAGPARDRFVRSKVGPGPLPAHDADIAFSPVAALSRWIESRALSSERLTRIYLDRLERFDPKLRCVITQTPDLALAQAKRADAEIAAGK